MRGIDITIGVVLVLAVVFSGIGVATYESTPQETDYRVTWATETQPITQREGTRTGNGATSIDVPMPFDNLTEVTLNVHVQGNGPRPTAVTASVTITPVNATAPAGKTINLAASPTGGGGDATFTIPIQDLPTVETVSGPDENTTYQELNDEYRTTNGSGIWKVTIQISGSTAGPQGIGAETFAITVTGEVKTYKPTIQVFTPDIER